MQARGAPLPIEPSASFPSETQQIELLNSATGSGELGVTCKDSVVNERIDRYGALDMFDDRYELTLHPGDKVLLVSRYSLELLVVKKSSFESIDKQHTSGFETALRSVDHRILVISGIRLFRSKLAPQYRPSLNKKSAGPPQGSWTQAARL